MIALGLQEKFTAFLRWEKRKRWELSIAALACYALGGALAVMLLSALVPIGLTPLWLPVGFAVLFAPLVLFQQRWIRQDEIRSLVALDKQLALDERAVTAWDALRRNQSDPAALWVVDQAGKKLESFDPHQSFPRRWSWQAYSVLPLAGLWLALWWLDVGTPQLRDGLRAPPTLAHKLKEFARELQDKAKSEGLKESLQAGKELEKLAQQNLDNQSSDAAFKKEVAGAAQKMAGAGKQAGREPSGAAASRLASKR